VWSGIQGSSSPDDNNTATNVYLHGWSRQKVRGC